MILAFDTYYFDDKAKTVCLLFSDWTDKEPLAIFTEIIDSNNDYVSGEFYKRELPCIISLLNKINIKEVSFIVLDGYVFLDDLDKYGLGGYLYDELKKAIPIIGVAKNNFIKLENNKKEVYRGESVKPLYVTSVGIERDEAAKKILSMYGNYRIPAILKLLDALTKEIK
jgi:deoxyribonuclease V